MRPSGAGFAGPLADGMAQFLEHKRVLGRRYETEAWALRLFDRYLVERHIETVVDLTPEVIDAFLISRPRHRPRSFNHLLGVLHRLFNWLVCRELIARSPVRTLTRRAGSARIPFIFAPEQARQLLDLAGRLPDVQGAEHRGRTFHAVFAVLYGLGMRVGEVGRLDIVDIDQQRRLLIIRDTKFGKDRLVPFGPRMGAMLDSYLALRRTREPRLADSSPLFTEHAGQRLTRHRIGHIFRRLLPSLALTVSASSSQPRVHDLRHSFAVGTLLRWYREGIDPALRLLHLSTFLGHVQPDSTAVYLTITTELLAEAGRRFENVARPLVTGVR